MDSFMTGFWQTFDKFLTKWFFWVFKSLSFSSPAWWRVWVIKNLSTWQLFEAQDFVSTPDYRHTDIHWTSNCNSPSPLLQVWEHRQTSQQTDAQYQVHYLLASRSIKSKARIWRTNTQTDRQMHASKLTNLLRNRSSTTSTDPTIWRNLFTFHQFCRSFFDIWDGPQKANNDHSEYQGMFCIQFELNNINFLSVLELLYWFEPTPEMLQSGRM